MSSAFHVPSGSSGDSQTIVAQLTRIVTSTSRSNHAASTTPMLSSLHGKVM